jgi:RNAse (barnase) inhibitor barstar
MEGALTGLYGAHPGLRSLDAMWDFVRVDLKRVVTDVFSYGGDQHNIFDAHLTCFAEAERHRPLTQGGQGGQNPVIY